MNLIPLVCLCLLQVASGHLFFPGAPENISVHGDVPKIGNVELGGKSSLTIAEALGLAGYDVSRFKTSKQPYPFKVSYTYVEERDPDKILDLRSQLEKSLQTSVNLGASIEVIDYEVKIKQLEELESQLDSNWEDKPKIAFERLQEVVHLSKFIEDWRQPNSEKPLSDFKRHYLNKISLESAEALNKLVLHEIAKIAKHGVEENSPPQFVRVMIDESLSWIDPEDGHP